jgi:carboxyl-terminal processing protease
MLRASYVAYHERSKQSAMQSSPPRHTASGRSSLRLPKRGIAGVVLVCIALASAGWISVNESVYYRISKALETYAEVFRRVSLDYVDEVEPEKFVRIGLDAMLASLDPYSVYMDEAQSDDFDSQISGRYVGLGIQVGVYDSMLTITGVAQGYAAEKAGLRIGDRLLSVDGTRVLEISPKDLRKYTRGERGSVAKVELLREGRSDTLRVEIMRSDITVKSVSYAARLDDGIAIIKLERFTRKTAQEMQLALDSLRALGSLNGIILDLRDNPGGLLDAAVSVCELFTKTGSVIVTTKGRREGESRVYTNNSVPYEAECPMAVLVNKASASAAEVVAGCLQDLDRAVVCGEQSFGKGLVQSQFPTPYGTTLKLTTQRYYCPSGRCIQRRDYSKKNSGTDSVFTPRMFVTERNRPVADASGITPDSLMKADTLPQAVQELVRKGVLFRVATQYAARYSSLPESFDPAALLPEVEHMMKDRGIDPHAALVSKLDEARALATNEPQLAGIESSLRTLQTEAKQQRSAIVRAHAKTLKRLLREEVLARFTGEQDVLRAAMESDLLLRSCADLLRSKSYARLLMPHVATRE